MKNRNKFRPFSIAIDRSRLRSRWSDVLMLVKFRLTLTVVFSAVVSYLIAGGGAAGFLPLLVLAAGGFTITGAANALNQVLEKDYDKLMKRTASRPVAAGRMSSPEAVLVAGLLFVTGIFLLAMFNPLTALLGSAAVIMYAFLYTPLKRYTPLSVFVGALPGALPTLIGCVAADGYISTLAIALFGLQFFWQFPHFWAIGWLGYNDYKKAGFKVVPEQDGQLHPQIGLQAFYFILMHLPFIALLLYIGTIHLGGMVIIILLTAGFGYAAINLQAEKTVKAAKILMFASIIYLPIVLLVILTGASYG